MWHLSKCVWKNLVNTVFPVDGVSVTPTKNAMNQLKFCKSAKGSGQSNFSSLDHLFVYLFFVVQEHVRDNKREKKIIRKKFAEMPREKKNGESD